MIFNRQSLVLKSFLVLLVDGWGTLFLYFLSYLFIWWCSFPIFPSIENFPFRQTFKRLLDSPVLIPSTCNIELGSDVTPTRSRGMSNNYITRGHRQVQLVGVQLVGERTSTLQRDMGPHDPRFSSPAERERSAAKDKGTGGQYVAVCSVSNSPLTHNPFATISNKACEVYFSKELCSFVIIVLTVSACIWLWLCNTLSLFAQVSLWTWHIFQS